MSYIVKSSEKTRKSGAETETKDEALRYFRHLTALDVRLLTLQRIINRNPIGQGVPTSFFPILRTCPPDQEKDFIQDCQASLSRALFDKNSADTFWALLENIYDIILEEPQLDVNEIFNQVDKDIRKNAKDFEEIIYSILELSEYKLDLEEINQIKSQISSLKDEKKLLMKQHKILSSKKTAVQYLSSVSDRSAFESKVNR